MFDITPYLTAIIMLLGIIVGTIISPRVSHRIGTEHSRKDLIFKRKLEYFEKIIETMEKNRKMYVNAIFKLEDTLTNSQTNKIIGEIKKERINFLKMASPLYFNTQNFSEKIIYFVRIEKDIFNLISELKENKDKKENIIERLKENLEKLDKKGNEILIEMKKELAK